MVTCANKMFLSNLSWAYFWLLEHRFRQWKNTSYIRGFMDWFSYRILSFSQVRKFIIISFNVLYTVGHRNKPFEIVGLHLNGFLWACLAVGPAGPSGSVSIHSGVCTTDRELATRRQQLELLSLIILSATLKCCLSANTHLIEDLGLLWGCTMLYLKLPGALWYLSVSIICIWQQS